MPVFALMVAGKTSFKPAHAQTAKKTLTDGQRKGVIAVVIIGVVIGISHLLSPSEEPAAAAPAAGSKPRSSSVTSLDDTTFEKFMNDHPDGVLVDFMKSDCKFCTKLAPEFEKAAQELKGTVPFASLDADAGEQMMKKYEITRYPTVYWFHKGENTLELQRASEKSAADISKWASWAIQPSVQDLSTQAEFDEALGTLRQTIHAKSRLMVGFHREGSGMREALEAAAQRHRATTVFLYITEATSGQPLLKSYGQSEANDEEYTGEVTATAVTQWVQGVLEKAKPPKEAKEDSSDAADKAKSAADQAIEQVQKALEKNAEAKEGNEEA